MRLVRRQSSVGSCERQLLVSCKLSKALSLPISGGRSASWLRDRLSLVSVVRLPISGTVMRRLSLKSNV